MTHIFDAILAISGGATLLTLFGYAAGAKQSYIPPGTPRVRRKALLTPNEGEFLARLTYALPHHLIFTQVAMSALMEPDTAPSLRKHWYAIRKHFAQKYVDFVVYDQARQSVVAVIELDDRTHDHARDAVRDAMLMRAGYRVLRYQSNDKPHVESLARDVLTAVPLKFRGKRKQVADQTVDLPAAS